MRPAGGWWLHLWCCGWLELQWTFVFWRTSKQPPLCPSTIFVQDSAPSDFGFKGSTF